MSKPTEAVLKKIKMYSDRLGKPYDFLLKEFNRLYEIEVNEHPNAKDYDERTFAELRGLIRKIDDSLIPSRAVNFRGGIIGDSGVMDHIAIIRQSAESMRDRNRQTRALAQKQRRIDRDGNVLDTRETVWENYKEVPNPKYGYPLSDDEHVYFRTLYGVAGIGEVLRDIKFFKMKLNAETAVGVKYSIWKKLNFRAPVNKRSTDEEYILGFGRNTKFEEIEADFDLLDLIKSCGKKIWNIDQIDEVYDLIGEDKAWDNPQLFLADVQHIEASPDRFNNRSFYLDNEPLILNKKSGIRFQFPISIPVENNRKVIALGYVNKFKNRDGEDSYSIRGYGYYPIPGFERD